MDQKPDMHDFKRQYNTAFVSLLKAPIDAGDKQDMEYFLKDCKARGIGLARLIKLAQILKQIAQKTPKPLRKATETDIKNLVRQYEEGDYSKWRRHDLKVIIKQYYAWLNKGIYPKKVAWICTTIPKHEKVMIYDGELLTQEEINKVINSTDHPRNKAIIAVLAESGARIGELGNLRIQQINIDPNGAVLTVEGKTGSRRIRLITSTPYLVNWLNNHPDRQNPQAPLWMNLGSRNYHHNMGYAGIRKVVQIAFDHAGIKKRCYPYIFRHTRACQLAHYLTEFQMNAYFGWVQGSDMPATYIHISGKDLDEHLLKINGLRPSETPILQKPEHRICPRCKEINAPQALYCGKCAEIVDPVLSLKTQIEINPKEERIKSPFMEWMQQDPEVKAMLKYKAEQFKTRCSH